MYQVFPYYTMIIKFDKYNESQSLELDYYAFDIDDNLLHMPTVIHMEKKVNGEWEPIDLTTAEFAKFRSDTENYRLLDNNPQLAFSEFRDTGIRGSDAFIEDLKTAVNNRNYGPSWDAFVKCLSQGSIFALITARGHEPTTFRRGVEYLIDNVLIKMPSLNPGFSIVDEMLQNLRKFKYLFKETPLENEFLKKGELPSANPIISSYLDHCHYFGVSSPTFARQFGEGSAQNPELAKEMALKYFIERCNEFGRDIGANKVSVGFSDDDPKNVEHVRKFFKENLPYMGVKLTLIDTSDPKLKGGVVTKFTETSHQATGMESSVLPFTKWNNMTQRLYPSTKDVPTDDYHNQLINQVKQSSDLYKRFGFNRKKNKQKK